MILMNRWLQIVRQAWQVYRKRLRQARAAEGMMNFEDFMQQMVDDDLTLQEFTELTFTEGFAAGEKHAKQEMFRDGERRYRVN